MLRALLRNDTAAALTEFALLAPVFFVFLFGTIEGGRLLWMQQTLETVAYSTARCASVSATCGAVQGAKQYAVARAAGYGVTIVTADVTVEKNVTCRGFPASNRTSITTPINSVMASLVPVFPESVTAESCYPVLTPPT
ncbi:TadE/TadG family type IV pilus assembly protein [Altererythrobacter lauratis]|uniref:TadE/TadG family type IV pilus assembly protein n=1 Tax=Alteraurantiacibacter lauratis TaxID=2054627 RepID=A0ABV7EGN5_9SPHN